MSYQEDNFTGIANAIRDKLKVTTPMKAKDFAYHISTIPTVSSEWQPDKNWWDIRTIVDLDTTEGYVAKIALLFDDQWLYHDLRGADAYRTSDGAFYESTSRTQVIRHNWQPSAYKSDARGYTTKYYIMYFRTNVVPNNISRAGGGVLFGYPIYAVGKDASIPFQNFLSSCYALQGYDHINCTYTGTNATAFLGGAAGTADFLQHFPDDIDFSNVTVFTNAINSRRLLKANLSTLNFLKLGATFSIMGNCVNLDTFIGTIDFTNYTPTSAFTGWQYIRTVNVVGIKRSIRLFSQSTMPHDTMMGIINNLPDLTGQSSITVSMYSITKTLTPEEIAIATNKNIILTD